MSASKTRLYINEVATRDGFQIEPNFIATDDKVALINRLSACGFAKIEATSFTSPKAIPMLHDADEVMGKIQRIKGVEYTVLVPNLRGAERAVEARADELNLVMSVSETHNNANLKMTREQSFSQLSQVINAMAALSSDQRPQINVSLSTSFGCPMEGEVDLNTVLQWSARYADLGVRGITLCDTTGMAFPSQVTALADAFSKQFSSTELTMHFHNTRGMGLANVLAAVQAGVIRFDASLGGLGGCPYAPGATGNICTEDAVHMLALMGYDTGIDEAALLVTARALPELLGHDIPSQLVKAGPRLHKAALSRAQFKEEK
jgi:hydroxymethylglutaryl-CoA lyase